MDISSQLKNANFEVWDDDEEDIIAESCTVARFGYNIDTGRIRVYDGTEFATVPIAADTQTDSVGDIKQTILSEAELDNSWLPLDGYGLYGDNEPYLAEDYPELAATEIGSSWIRTIDLGYSGGEKEYLLIPDARSCVLLGSEPDSAFGTTRYPLASLGWGISSQPLSYQNLTAGTSNYPTLPFLIADSGALESATLNEVHSSADSGGDFAALTTGSSLTTVQTLLNIVVAGSTSATTTVENELIPQSLTVNIYIKARSEAISE